MATGAEMRRHRHRPQHGALLLGVLVFLAVASMGLAGISQRWADARQRDAEEDLLYTGLQYQKAIESYWKSTPGAIKQFPVKLDDLLQDTRFAQPVRHLRRLWPDPMQPNKPWGLMRQGNGIVGVYSQSGGQPFRSANFDPALPQEVFGSAGSYRDWRFVSAVGVTAAASAAGEGDGLPVFQPVKVAPARR